MAKVITIPAAVSRYTAAPINSRKSADLFSSKIKCDGCGSWYGSKVWLDEAGNAITGKQAKKEQIESKVLSLSSFNKGEEYTPFE